MGEDMIKGVNEWRKYKYKNLLKKRRRKKGR
jgi:hypothetical protein